MILTSEQAQRIICPLAIAADPGRNQVEYAGKLRNNQTCRGNACMAWRPREDSHGETGYCGMAGVPSCDVNQLHFLLGEILDAIAAKR